jgi:CDP-paratose 2-epimerase
VTPPLQAPVLITGGAGFIGSNLADRLASRGRRVRIYDNLSRAGVEENLEWLRERHGGLIEPWIGDVRDRPRLAAAALGASAAFHFAAQVAVTTSIEKPDEDFEINLRGTLNLLEALRTQSAPPALIYTSTNKVYGALSNIAFGQDLARHAPADAELAATGVSEAQALDFYSPYGCSKGAADQYVLDYARIYGLRTVVFRMSCIYGSRQFGTEDQGWVAHFLISALADRSITIYGDGRQVRDVLYVDDLLDAFERAEAGMARLSGRAFNIGGGPENAVSLREMLEMIGRLTGRKPRIERGPTRPGDQPWYVSDIRKFAKAAGWRPLVNPRDGLARLHRWLAPRIAKREPLAPNLRAHLHEIRPAQS